MTIEDEADRLRAAIEQNEPLIIDGKRYYVVEGDLLLPASRVAAYSLEQARQRAAPPDEEPDDRLTSATTPDRKRLLRWRPGKLLTYSVRGSTFSTPGLFEAVRDNLRQAARDWEAICGVRFEELEERADPAAPAPVFTVEEFFDPRFLALAFFPDASPEERVIRVDANYLTTRFDPVGVLRHELGHVLAFRHEHIRKENSAERLVEPHEELSQPLTAYDAHSVMHYPPEGVVASFALTAFDRRGASFVYGGPLRLFKDYD